jgi:hypothetical protein
MPRSADLVRVSSRQPAEDHAVVGTNDKPDLNACPQGESRRESQRKMSQALCPGGEKEGEDTYIQYASGQRNGQSDLYGHTERLSLDPTQLISIEPEINTPTHFRAHRRYELNRYSCFSTAFSIAFVSSSVFRACFSGFHIR